MVPDAINRETFEFTCTSEAVAGKARREFELYIVPQINAIIEDVLAQYEDPATRIVIDSIEIDLGKIDLDNIENEAVLEKFEQTFREKVRNIQAEHASRGDGRHASYAEDMNMELISRFFLHGDLPWWVDKTQKIDPEIIFHQWVARNPGKARTFLEDHIDNPALLLRLSAHQNAVAGKLLGNLDTGGRSQAGGKRLFGAVEQSPPALSSGQLIALLALFDAGPPLPDRQELLGMLAGARNTAWMAVPALVQGLSREDHETLVTYIQADEDQRIVIRQKALKALQSLTVFQAAFLVYSFSNTHNGSPFNEMLDDVQGEQQNSPREARYLRLYDTVIGGADSQSAADQIAQPETGRGNDMQNEAGFALGDERAEDDVNSVNASIDKASNNPHSAFERIKAPLGRPAPAEPDTDPSAARRQSRETDRLDFTALRPDASEMNGREQDGDGHDDQSGNAILPGDRSYPVDHPEPARKIPPSDDEQFYKAAGAPPVQAKTPEASLQSHENVAAGVTAEGSRDADVEPTPAKPHADVDIFHDRRISGADGSADNEMQEPGAPDTVRGLVPDSSAPQTGFSINEDKGNSPGAERISPAQAEQGSQEPFRENKFAQQAIMQKIGFIMRRLNNNDGRFLAYLQQLTTEELDGLHEVLDSTLQDARTRSRMISRLLEHPYLLRYNLLSLYANLSFQYPAESRRDAQTAENTQPGETRDLSTHAEEGRAGRMQDNAGERKEDPLTALTRKIRYAQADFLAIADGMTFNQTIILRDVLKKKQFDSKSEKEVMRKLFRKVPLESIRVLDFLTQLPEEEIRLLDLSSRTQMHYPAGDPTGSDSASSEPEKIFIENAGLCLVALYLPGLFRNLGYVEGRTFRNKAYSMRALFVLQYLVSGDPRSHEFLLQFNKLLTGFDLEDPVASVRLTKKEMSETDSLIEAVVENWKALKNTSVDGFRTSFLQRKGILSEKSGCWLLQVERKGHDVLLNSIPWGFTMIKLPWMKKMIEVEW